MKMYINLACPTAAYNFIQVMASDMSCIHSNLVRPCRFRSQPRVHKWPTSKPRRVRADAALQDVLPSGPEHQLQGVNRFIDGSLAFPAAGVPDFSELEQYALELKRSAEPHWGTDAVKSTLQDWVAAVSKYIDASLSSNAPISTAAAELSEWLRAVKSELEQVLAAHSGSQQGGQLFDTVRQLFSTLEDRLASSASSELSALLGAASKVQWSDASQIPPIPDGSVLPGVLLAVAGALAVFAARQPPPPPPSGPGNGGGPGGSQQPSENPGSRLPSVYDADEVGAYFKANPLLVARRAAQVAAQASDFGVFLLYDKLTDTMEKNSYERAAQLRSIIEQLGPAYVKIAQALSTRVDILNPAYLLEIERLQDRVPPFANSAALQSVEAAYGRPINEVFSSISASPVAAASLGQVYRGVLSPEYGGHEVAIKVRRPQVLESVGLDLYLMRQVALYLRSLPQVKSDWVAIIDNWAEAFFAEMDYVVEAANARRFKEDMEEKQLTGIVVPDVYLATHDVLITQWIEGEKLCESTASDVRELCNTLLSAYLVQLLETGFLHADPHPGNLLRTPDGKIAILDYGLMSTVPENYSLALVEYIAHLSVGDYEGVAEDLVKLGFMSEDGDRTGLVEPLGILLAQLTAGGGAANINIDVVMGEIDRLATRYPFQVPAYFTLILRCFSVIEGIALRVDPEYAIVTECFPYLSRRLLTDNNPRARKALRDLLFGQGQHIDLERLQRLANGFGQYTVAGLTDVPRNVSSGQSSQPRLAVGAGLDGSRSGVDVAGDRRPILSPAAKEALLVLFSQEGNYAQELVVEEAAAALDAASRQLAAAFTGRLLGSRPALARLNAIKALGPWRPLLLPLPTPLELLNRAAPALQPNEDDLQALATARGVFDIMQRFPTSDAAAPSIEEAQLLADELRPLLPQLLPGAAKTGELLARQLVRRVALRVAADMQAGTSFGRSDEKA